MLIAIAAGIPAAVAGDPASLPDSLSTDVTLSEITVEAPRIIRKADMDVLYPSRSAIENSSNALALLNRMMIPTLTVNEFLGSVKSSGLDVQIRINGRTATIEQLKTIEPETVRRVEWIDNPGLRYGEANSVINFIVINPTVGGSLMTSAMTSLACAWGEYYADLKLNYGRSQWSIGGLYKATNHIDGYREYSETFTHPDGSKLTRIETPLSGNLNDPGGAPWLNYSYINPDKTVIWIGTRLSRQWKNGTDYNSVSHLSDGTPDLFIHDKTVSSGVTPRLNAYIEQHLAGNHTIVADLNASIYNGHSSHIYTERQTESPHFISDVNTAIRDRNRTISFETDYIKKWTSSRLTAGISYTANRNRSTYVNLGNAVYHQRQDRLYFFSEYFQRIRNLSISAGLGAQYTGFKIVESDRRTSSWALRPRLSVAWRPNSTNQLRLNFKSWQNTPSLSESNEAPQQIDGFQWQYGNPDLRTYTTYRLSLNYNLDLRRVSATLGAQWLRSPHAIAPTLYWDDDRLITTFENSRGRTEWQAYLSPQIQIIPSWLTAQGTVRYTITRTTGTGYRHLHRYWSGDINLMLTHWGFTLNALYQINEATLLGEKISRGEKFSLLLLSYHWNNFEFAAGMMMPFGRYSQGTESLNRYNTNHYTMRTRSIERTPVLQITYNLNWGHQKRGASKLINSDSSVQQSTPASR